MKMSEIKGLKIFICLIFTVAAVILWISVQCSMAADVSHTQYEGRCLSIMKQDIYIKLDNHVRTGHKEICLKDVASVYCGDGNLKTRAEQVVIFSFDGEEKEVISILYIYEKLYEAVGEDIQIHSIGESDCVIDLTDGKRPPKLWSKIQVVFVSLVTFSARPFRL